MTSLADEVETTELVKSNNEAQNITVKSSGNKSNKSSNINNNNSNNNNKSFKEDAFVLAAMAFEILFIILYAVGVKYKKRSDEVTDDLNDNYATYLDVHTMMFVGFGFLMTFLRKYSFGSISFNFLICVFCIQWGMFIFGFIVQGGDGLDKSRKLIRLDITSLLDADLGSAAVLISFGAVLGRAEPLQLLIMAFIEITIYSINFYVCVESLEIVDVGGSIVVHTFGAYFGLAVSAVIGKPENTEENKSMYHSDLFAMIGTLFLWLFWPSFNGYFATLDDNGRERAFINTVISLSSGTLTTFAISRFLEDGTFDMVHVQNATLAGGVAIGACADLYVHPAGAMAVGVLAGALSVFGYSKFHEKLEEIVWFDTCGVHNLHGMPGILGAIVSAIVIAAGTDKLYKDNPETCGNDCITGSDYFPHESYSKQAGYQIAGLCVTLLISLVGGTITGLILKTITKLSVHPFSDEDNFIVPAQGKDIYRGTIRDLGNIRNVMEEMDINESDSDDD